MSIVKEMEKRLEATREDIKKVALLEERFKELGLKVVWVHDVEYSSFIGVEIDPYLGNPWLFTVATEFDFIEKAEFFFTGMDIKEMGLKKWVYEKRRETMR